MNEFKGCKGINISLGYQKNIPQRNKQYLMYIYFSE